MRKSVHRLNAKARPSGENAGAPSRNTWGEGDVSLRFSVVSTDKRTNALGSFGESRSLTTSHLPSGDQARFGDGNSTTFGLKISAILRSGPPRAGMRSTADFSGERSRTNAMNRPSGDQAGL